MTEPGPTFDHFPLEDAIGRRAASCGFTLEPERIAGLAKHARLVIAANASLHLTTVVDPLEFVERHLGEAFEGAALLPRRVAGTLVDLGSGNGYPALPVAAVCSELRPVLVEASARKAAFLRDVLTSCQLGSEGEVIERQVQRATDLMECTDLRVLTCRAVGGWERLVPKLASLLADEGSVLLWAGDAVETVRRRVAWRKLELKERRGLPGRDRSAVWRFERQA